MSAGSDDTTTSGPPSGGRPPDTAAEGDPGMASQGGGSSATSSMLVQTGANVTQREDMPPTHKMGSPPGATATGSPPVTASTTGQVSSQTTTMGSQPNAASTTGHPSPQTTGSPPNAASTTGQVSSQTTTTGSQPNAASTTGQVSSQTTTTGSPPNAASTTGQVSPQTTTMGSQPNAASTTGQVSSQTTTTGSQPNAASTTGQVSSQTTTTGSQPNAASTTGQVSSQTTTMGSQPNAASTTGQVSSQTTTTGSQPNAASTTGQVSSQTTTTGSQPNAASTTGHTFPETIATGSQPNAASTTEYTFPETSALELQPGASFSPERADSQKHTKKTGDCVDGLIKRLGELSVGRSHRPGEHQRGSNDSVDIATESHSTSQQLPGSSSIQPQVHTSAARKKGTESFSVQKDGVSNTGCDQKGSRSHGTSASAGPQKDKTPDEQSMLPASVMYIQEHQKDSLETVSIVFETVIQGNRYTTKYPQAIDVPKWKWMKNNGIEDLLSMTGDEKKIVFIQENLGKVVVTLLTVHPDEAHDWTKFCMQKVSECLERIQSVVFTGTDIMKYLPSDAQLAEFYYQLDSDKRSLTVFAINSEAIDKFMERAVPLLNQKTNWKMLIKIPLHLQKLMMLEKFGFKQHYERLVQGVKLFANYKNREYIFDCQTDLRHSVESEIQAFMQSLERVVLDVPDLFKAFLFDEKGFFQQEMARQRLCFWVTEIQGAVEILSPSREMLSRVEEIVIKCMICVNFIPFSQKHYQQYLTTLAQVSHSSWFCYQEGADGKSIELAGFSEEVHNCLWNIYVTPGTPVTWMQASIRTDISEKLSRQALSGSTGGPSRKSKCFGDGDRQSEQERTTRAANQPGEEEQNGSRDRPSAQGDRPDRSVEPSRKQEQTGTGGDRQTRGQENVTHRPSKGIEKTDDRGSRSNYQEMLVFNTQAEGNRRSSSLHTQPSQCMQVTADRKAQPPDSYARIPEMSVPPAKGHAMAPQIPEMSVPPAQGHAVAPQGPAQIHPKTHTGNAGSMEMHKYNKYPIPAHVAQLLQVPDVIDKFKAKLMDKQCLVDCQSVPGGFIMIKEDSREEDVSSTLRELLHQEVIEVGEDDQDVEKALNSLREKYAGKVSCVSEEGRWNICVTADIKEDIHGEVEKLQQAQCLVPLPLYAAELLALDIDRVHGDIKRDVDSSVRVNITDGEGKQGVELSSARKFIKQAVQWMHDFVLELEITNRALSVSEALFFQDLEGQNMIQKVEGGEFCRIDAVVDEDWSGLCATSPSGQRLLVCRDAMAATDCDCIVLPLWKGQTEWTPLQRWILRRSLLSENITSYQEWCQENPISLLGSADFQGKTIIIVPVPAWEDGAAKEKEKITNFYKQAFEMCGKNQHSVGVCAKQCAKQSPSISFRKSLTALLCAVWETFSTQDPPSTTCKTVVMYTDSAQEAKVTCQAVTQGLPQGWRVKPPRAPRPRSGKGIIEVCLGEIQKTKADVIVNSTNRKLICDQGAVEKAIGETAGPEMYKACRELYPQGIPENGLAITNSFRMENAKRIYHIALSQDIFDGDKQRVLLYNLRQVILHCLVKASLEEHATIAFPTLGSGMLQYPCDVVASTMFSTIHTFFTEMPHTTLQKVIIVVFPKNLPAIQAFKMEEISRLYTFSTEEKRATYEMQMNLKSHKIQVIHGNVFQEPWVSDFCVHGKLASERGESPSKVQGCQSIVVDTREDYRKYVRTALLRARTVQIAADTLRSETLTDLALALESVLSQDKQGHCLVSVVFSDEEKAMKFQQSFKDVECGHVVPGEGKRNRGQMFVCSYKGGEEMARKIEEFEVSPRYKELLKVYRESGADQAQKEGENERGDNKEPDQVSISLPKSFLENVNLAQILKVQFTRAEREGMTNISVRLTDLVNTAKALAEGIGNKPFEKESGGSEKVSGPGEESESTDGWERNLDEFQVEALKYLLREEFDQTFDMKKNQDGVLLTFKGASSRALENQVDSLRREDVQLNPEEVAKLDDIVDVRSEGVEAFVRTVRNMDKATVFALDYTAMSKAKHLVNVRAGRVKVTARSRRRFETGNSGPPDQATPQTGGMLHGAGSDVQTKIFTTPSGVKVSVYKTDITKLPVDAIVNAANEHLAHGGGVAYYISKAAGFALEEEGREHLRKHGDLIVTDVVATTAGSLPCQKVLHAVGPRWVSYQDKAQCQQLLVDTVFNCLYKAHSLGFTSLALPSISAAIFGVPQPICAQSYLSAVKKFDTIHGHSTPLKEIHFVDINDGMTSVIQSTFSADWSVPASSTPGNQGVEAAAGVRNRQEESSRPVHSLPAASQENRLDMLPKEGPRPRQGPESGNQGQPPGHTAGLQDEPAGFPCLTERWSEKENQVQVVFKDRDLTLIFQKQSVTDIETESVILWQDVQNIMRDNIWKQFVKKLSPQAKTRTHMINKEMSTADKTYTFRTTNKQYVFIVTSSRGSCGEEKIRDFVEQAFNRVDLDKTSVAIPRKQKEEKGKPSNKDREETEVFISGLYRAVKNYAERANRSIREIHVGEPDLDILRFMGDKVKTLIGIDQSLLDQKKSQPSSSQSASPASSTAHSPDPCSICHSEPDNPKALTCGHVFCTSCIDQWFQTKPTCPTCNSIQGTVRGDQPKDGIMGMKYSSFSACDGFPQGMYTVDYWFPSGKQKENHPNPGKWYNSTRRIAFLPDTAEGRKVLMLLKVAFDRRLIFTVGKSATTDSVGIIWNDIHHKTLCSGGAESHGYPDPTYLTRVQEELAAKGVTEKDLTNVQHDFIANPAKVQSQYRYDFSDYFGTPV